MEGSHLQETAADEVLPSEVAKSLFSTSAQERDLNGSTQKETSQRTSLTLSAGLYKVYEAPLRVHANRDSADQQHCSSSHQLSAAYNQKQRKSSKRSAVTN